jgi:hypothetical protein
MVAHFRPHEDSPVFDPERPMRATAFVTALLAVAVALPAQESTRARRARLGAADTLYRDPVSARVLGAIIPGAGHVYAGEYGRGLGYYYGTVGTIGMGAMTYVLDKCAFSFLSLEPCKSPPAWPHQVAGVAIVAYGAGVWVYSAIDAGHAAERANKRHARQHAAVSPFVAPRAGNGGANVGLSVAW